MIPLPCFFSQSDQCIRSLQTCNIHKHAQANTQDSSKFLTIVRKRGGGSTKKNFFWSRIRGPKEIEANLVVTTTMCYIILSIKRLCIMTIDIDFGNLNFCKKENNTNERKRFGSYTNRQQNVGTKFGVVH